MPAEKQPRRHHIKGLETLMHPSEDLLEVRQYGPGELIDQKRPIRMEYRVGLAEDDLTYLGRNGGVRNARNDVVGMAQIEACESGICFDRGTVNYVQPVVVDFTPQKPNEVGIGFQDNQHRVRAHAPENFGGEGADPGSILEEDPGSGPVYFAQNLIDQKARARNQAPEHLGVLDKIASEEQNLLRTRGTQRGHCEGSAFQIGLPRQPARAGFTRRRRADTEQRARERLACYCGVSA